MMTGLIRDEGSIDLVAPNSFLAFWHLGQVPGGPPGGGGSQVGLA